jgi:hypothetical protein
MKNITLASALMLCFLLAGCIEDGAAIYPYDAGMGYDEGALYRHAQNRHHNRTRPTFTHSEGVMHRDIDTHRTTDKQEWGTEQATRENQWQDTPNGGILRSQGSSHTQRHTEEHSREKSTERWEGSRMDIRFR